VIDTHIDRGNSVFADDHNLTSQVSWSSSNPAAATVRAAGLATGVAPGTANIAASSGEVSGATILTVE
jgi:uncharacterized protein YjdB